MWLLGFHLSSALFNLVLFAFLRDRIHLWYVAYMVGVTLFLMMEDGLDALLLPAGPYRLLWSVGQYNFMLLAAAAGIRIMQLFLRLRASWPRLHRAGNWLAGVVVGFVAGYAGLFPWAVRHSLPTVEVLNGVREVLMVLVFGYGWTVLLALLRHRRWRRLAAYYALTFFFFFFVGYGIFWLNHLGLNSFNPIHPNTLAWGLMLELLILSALLTGRFRHTLRHNARLRVQHLRQRERDVHSARLIAAQDDEREQLARELHDALGPNIAALHMAWQSEAMRAALASAPAAAAVGQLNEDMLRELYNQARQISHVLLPAESVTNRLTTSITTLRDMLNLHGTPQVHTDFGPGLNELPPAVQSAAFRIMAELVNNAVRHAQARQVHVHLHRLPTALELCVADDGRGFGRGEDTPLTGIGLRGVRTRAAYLGGSVSIEVPKVGTRVIVRLPC
ncbi:sensor histidine kinase [Hymenobacter siberiensis]|uniref:sensor histidine kinase n=1 Tax=Hymenobacter siberiensis TaxID=2848396 RepID=UPI00293D3A87|nr:7TM diverse intracellular signaling domain-containing protein [Hymenobacter siberiensis]